MGNITPLNYRDPERYYYDITRLTHPSDIITMGKNIRMITYDTKENAGSALVEPYYLLYSIDKVVIGILREFNIKTFMTNDQSKEFLFFVEMVKKLISVRNKKANIVGGQLDMYIEFRDKNRVFSRLFMSYSSFDAWVREFELCLRRVENGKFLPLFDFTLAPIKVRTFGIDPKEYSKMFNLELEKWFKVYQNYDTKKGEPYSVYILGSGSDIYSKSADMSKVGELGIEEETPISFVTKLVKILKEMVEYKEYVDCDLKLVFSHSRGEGYNNVDTFHLNQELMCEALEFYTKYLKENT